MLQSTVYSVTMEYLYLKEKFFFPFFKERKEASMYKLNLKRMYTMWHISTEIQPSYGLPLINHLTVGGGRPYASHSKLALSSTPTVISRGFDLQAGAAEMVCTWSSQRLTTDQRTHHNMHACTHTQTWTREVRGPLQPMFPKGRTNDDDTGFWGISHMNLKGEKKQRWQAKTKFTFIQYHG